jgi:hypothetical protein
MNPEAGLVVQSLGSAIHHGESRLSAVPGLMKRVLREGLWRKFTTPRGELVTYDRIEPFVVTPPTKGLGATVELITRVLQDDVEALSMWDEALRRPVGCQPTHRADDNNIQALAPQWNLSKPALFASFRTDAPQLHQEVLQGRLSAHAAMVQAGYRKRTITVTLEPHSAAQTLRKHMTPEQWAELVRIITSE